MHPPTLVPLPILYLLAAASRGPCNDTTRELGHDHSAPLQILPKDDETAHCMYRMTLLPFGFRSSSFPSRLASKYHNMQPPMRKAHIPWKNCVIQYHEKDMSMMTPVDVSGPVEDIKLTKKAPHHSNAKVCPRRINRQATARLDLYAWNTSTTMSIRLPTKASLDELIGYRIASIPAQARK